MLGEWDGSGVARVARVAVARVAEVVVAGPAAAVACLILLQSLRCMGQEHNGQAQCVINYHQ